MVKKPGAAEKKGAAVAAAAASTTAAAAAPRWVASLGALIAAVTGIGGLAYTWYSHFNAKVEPPKPASASTPARNLSPMAASVSVSGSSNVGVGNNTGTINMGQPAAPAPTALSGQGATKP